MFNLEMKITWKELAPSLQSMFKTLQSQITDNRQEIDNINTNLDGINEKLEYLNNSITEIKNDINNIENSITDINKEISNIQGDINNINNDIDNLEENYINLDNKIDNTINNITNIIRDNIATGEQGQVLKIDNIGDKGIFVDDNFHNIYVFDNQSEVDKFKREYNYDLNMQEVFDKWQSNRSMNSVIYNNGIFTDQSSKNNFVQKNTKDTNWKYSDGYLVMNLNQTVYCTFISLEAFAANSYIEVLVSVIDKNDDDIISIIFGYTEDENNYYTLEYMISPNHSNQCKYSSCITYNLAQANCKILLSQPNTSEYHNSSSKYISKFKIEKEINKVTVSRTYFYTNEEECINAPYYYTAAYEYPSTKPNDWSDDEYKRIGTMFNESKIGFGTISWNCKFKVLSSNIGTLAGATIYNINNDIMENYSSGKWITSDKKSSEVLPYRVLLYNDWNNTLFFYYYKQNYKQIILNGGGGINDDEDQTGDGELSGVPEGSPDWLKFIPQQGNNIIYDCISLTDLLIDGINRYGLTSRYDGTFGIHLNTLDVYIIRFVRYTGSARYYPDYYKLGSVKDVFGNNTLFCFTNYDPYHYGDQGSYRYFYNTFFTIEVYNKFQSYSERTGLNKFILGL